MTSSIVIVGAAYAGLAAAAAARQNGFDGKIHIVSEEADLPYQRTLLSKSFLLEDLDPLDLLLRGEKFYRDLDIGLVLGQRATAVSLREQSVQLASGREIKADAIVLATGAAARPLGDFDPSAYAQLRTLADARALKARLETAGEVIVVGGGLIGLETAAAARKLGKGVTVVEAAPRLLSRITSDEVARYVFEMHHAHGVQFEFGAPVELRAHGGGCVLTLRDGRVLRGDLVLAGVGSLPNVDLAEQAGLKTANGIVTDGLGRTSAPKVFAAGDCARALSPWLGEWIRVESVQSATDQGKIVGAALAGAPPPPPSTPRYASAQFDMHLQVVGIPSRGLTSELLAGEAGRISEVYEKDGLVVGVVSLNDPWLHNRARKEFQKNPFGFKRQLLLATEAA